MIAPLFALALLAAAPAPDPAPPTASTLATSVEELRGSIGRWEVATKFLNPDGSVAKAVHGAYVFDWVIPDRLVSGKSEIPELGQVSALLFYISEDRAVIEMVSVGAEGKLWVMTGPLGGDFRQTPDFKTADGGSGRLRFTRFNVTATGFESKMEITSDGGKTWLPGNHQVFRRVASPAAG